MDGQKEGGDTDRGSGGVVSDERFRLLVESVTEYAIFMLDPRGIIVSWNSGAQRLKGWTASEIVGRHFSTFYPPEDVARDKPGRELEIAAAEGVLRDEGWRVRKDGSRFWASVVITAMRDFLFHARSATFKPVKLLTKRGR